MAGWFKINRDIETHWIWTSSEPFDKRSAWIDLILLANHTDFKTVRKGVIVLRKRGDVNTSSRFLATRWRWSRGRVDRFLKLLESDGMITLSGATDGTTITIENYDKWQKEQATDETTNSATDRAIGEATDGANDKKTKEYIKNGKNIYMHERNIIPPSLDMVSDYIYEHGYQVDAQKFMDFYESKGWFVGKNKMKDWQAAVRTWNKNKPSYTRNTNPFTEMLRNGDY